MRIAAGRWSRLQDRGRAIPHVDAGCLRWRADAGHRVHVGRPEGGGIRGDHPILVQGLGPLRDDWYLLIAVLAILTMRFGNIVALSQRNIKRMLAYSSIAHTGYMLVGSGGVSRVAGAGRFVSLAGDAAHQRSRHHLASLLHAGLHIHEHRRVRRHHLGPAPGPRDDARRLRGPWPNAIHWPRLQ